MSLKALWHKGLILKMCTNCVPNPVLESFCQAILFGCQGAFLSFNSGRVLAPLWSYPTLISCSITVLSTR